MNTSQGNEAFSINAVHAATEQLKKYHQPQVADFGPINELTRSGFFSEPHELAADGLGAGSNNDFFPNY